MDFVNMTVYVEYLQCHSFLLIAHEERWRPLILLVCGTTETQWVD